VCCALLCSFSMFSVDGSSETADQKMLNHLPQPCKSYSYCCYVEWLGVKFVSINGVINKSSFLRFVNNPVLNLELKPIVNKQVNKTVCKWIRPQRLKMQGHWFIRWFINAFIPKVYCFNFLSDLIPAYVKNSREAFISKVSQTFSVCFFKFQLFKAVIA